MKPRNVFLAATALAAPYAASAQPVTGLYVGAGAGVNITQRAGQKTLVPHLGGSYRSELIVEQPAGQHWARNRGVARLGVR